jgi:sortase (surface protein transpeptidase)
MTPTPTTSNALGALALAFATVAVATALIASGSNASPGVPAIERIQAAAEFAPTPKPEPVEQVPPIAVASRPSDECPQMNNPGGRLNWAPTPQQGPAPTNGTIHMPTLGVSARIVRVGIDGANKMVVPHNAKDVAWLDRGGIPGYTNNVVLAGHISYSRVAGSFQRIGSLRVGDEIVFEMDGKKRRYQVQWSCLFSRQTDRAEQIMGYTNEPSLTLISCGGGWDAGARTHTGRWAVRAVEMVDQQPIKLKRTNAEAAEPEPTSDPLIDVGP